MVLLACSQSKIAMIYEGNEVFGSMSGILDLVLSAH